MGDKSIAQPNRRRRATPRPLLLVFVIEQTGLFVALRVSVNIKWTKISGTLAPTALGEGRVQQYVRVEQVWPQEGLVGCHGEAGLL
jgi:hypothetical protein